MLTGCSATNLNAQAQIDTLACNSLSYGNENADLNSLDHIFNKCMSIKAKARDKMQDDAEKEAIFDFIFSIFFDVVD